MNGSEFGFDSGKREMRFKRTYRRFRPVIFFHFHRCAWVGAVVAGSAKNILVLVFLVLVFLILFAGKAGGGGGGCVGLRLAPLPLSPLKLGILNAPPFPPLITSRNLLGVVSDKFLKGLKLSVLAIERFVGRFLFGVTATWAA